MSDSHIIIADIAATSDAEESRLMGTNIKEEVVNSDDILLFTQAEMAEFSSDSTNFQIVSDIFNNAESVGDNVPFNIQSFDEAQVSQLLSDDNFAKYPIDLGQVCKLETGKHTGSNHFIKYKMQDGKHSKIWECGICAKEFGHQYTLMRHLPTHTDERKFQCNICGKAFRQMSTLSQHRAIHSAERPYVCEICHKTFNRVSTLISHRKTHTGLKPHRCHLCNKAFHQKGNLRNHIFTHTNERPYKCDICSKGFNQMSNLMCHKIKAHQRADKPRYVCQICGKDFQKRMGLRNHEQYQHGIQNVDSNSSAASTTRIKYTNGVLVDPINTAAMQHALATSQTPFALLRPLNGIPVLVRVLAAGDKQMLVPATAEDLKKHGQITITPQVDEQKKNEEGTSDPLAKEAAENIPEADEKTVSLKPLGSTVQIKIPVVATVVQRCGKDGNMCMAVQSPGPSMEGMMNENYVFTTTAIGDGNGDEGVQMSSFASSFENTTFENPSSSNHIQTSTQIQYIDECGNMLTEEEYKSKNMAFLEKSFQFEQQNNMFGTDFQLNNEMVNLQENHQSILRDIDTENVMNISYVEGSTEEQMFKILEKPQMISLSDTDSVLTTSNVLCDTSLGPNFELP